jgi:DNA polymerase (family 10)
MPTNAEISRVFAEIAAVLELTGANVYRISAYNNAARIVADHTQPLASLDKKQLMAIDGIGEGTASKILEFVQTGQVGEHQKLIATVPPGIILLTRIPGVGPKTAKMLWEKAGITDVESLKARLDSGELEKLPRMGEKTVANIRKSIEFIAQGESRTRLGDALLLAENLIEFLKQTPGAGVKHLEYAGSLRRGCETIGDIDFVAVASNPAKLSDAFTSMPLVSQVLGKGETKSSVRLNRNIQVDLRIVPEESFGAALMYFTGSKLHNVALRERAIKMKFRLNEYGLYPLDDEDEPPQKRGIKPVASKTEEDIYRKLKLPYFPPEMREDRGELGLKAVPKLVELSDIQCELHAHTTASDGRLSIEELASEAKSRGFHTIAITDHSQSSVQARGLSPKRLEEHIIAVREAQKRIKGIEILMGAEVDILGNGLLDYDDALLKQLDIVIASPHAVLKQSPEDATKRLIRAIEHPLVHIIGHPTGRIIGRRDGLPLDMSAVIAAAVKHNVALEVNANHYRLDLRDTHARAAVDAGCLIAVNTDAHSHDDFDELRYGVLTARRGWLTAEQCINCWQKAKLMKWLKSKR